MKTVSHGGNDEGFRSLVAIAPEEHVAVLVVSNDDNAPVGRFAFAVLSVLYPELAAAAANEN